MGDGIGDGTVDAARGLAGWGLGAGEALADGAGEGSDAAGLDDGEGDAAGVDDGEGVGLAACTGEAPADRQSPSAKRASTVRRRAGRAGIGGGAV